MSNTVAVEFDQIDMKWIQDHFNDTLPWGQFLSTLTLAINEEPLEWFFAKERFRTNFLHIIASTKYRWTWLSEGEKTYLMHRIADCLKILQSKWETYQARQDSLNNLREYLQGQGWMLL